MPSLFESYGLIEPEAAGADRPEPPKNRTLAAAANDTVIEVANAAAGGVKAVSDFVSPGNAVSRGLDRFIQSGEESQSDVVKADKQRFRSEVDAAQGIGDELAAVGGYVVRNPLLTAAQAAGSFALPGGAVKGASAAARGLGLTAPAAVAAGRAAGVVAGAAMGGGDAAGNAYDLVMQAPIETLLQHPKAQALAEQGASEDQIRDTLATSAARDASLIPALIGGASGAFGAERLIAGGARRAGMGAVAAAGLSEAGQEGIEEGATQFEGQRAAAKFNPEIDPTKGVAAAAGLGAVMGGGTGAGAHLLSHPAPSGPLSRAANAAAQPAAGLMGIEPAAGGAAAPAAVAQAAREEPALDPVAERIKLLPEGDREEALAAYNILNREDAPKGVRQYNSRLLDELLAKLEPQEQPSQMEASDPAALLSQGMGRDPVQGAIAQRRDEQTAMANLESWMARAQPLPLQRAQEIAALGAEQGHSLEVVPHNAGQGFTVIPSQWVTPEMRNQVATALPMATEPTGVLRADARGNVAAETQAQAIDSRQAQAAQEAERQRKNDLGLTPDVEAVQAGVKRAPKPEPLPTDVKNKQGQPFKNKGAALRAQKAAGGGDVVEVQGGWVVRTAAAAPAVQQGLEAGDVGNRDATVALAAGDGGHRGDDAGAGGRDPAAAGSDARGDVVRPAGSPAAAGEEGAAVRAAGGEQAAAVAEAPVAQASTADGSRMKPAEATAAAGERWAGADAAERERVLLSSGWQAGSPGVEKMKGQAWDKMTQGQRNRIAKAVAAAAHSARAQDSSGMAAQGKADNPAPEIPAEAVQEPSATSAASADEQPQAEATPVSAAQEERSAAVPPRAEDEAGQDQTPAPAAADAARAAPAGADAGAAPGVEAAGVAQTPAKPTAPATPKPGSIQDAGEKIGGARKDRWKERGLAVADLEEMSHTEGAELAVKKNVWVPDYEAIAKESEPVTAAMVKVVYDSLAAKPKLDTPQGRRDYVQAMQAVRKVYGAVKTVEEAKNAYVKLREELGVSQHDRLTEEGKAARRVMFSLYKGRSDPFVFDYNALARAKSLVKDGFPAIEPWKRRLVVRGFDGKGVTPAGMRLYMEQSAEAGTPLTEEQVRGQFWRVSDLKGKVLGYFTSKEDAEAGARTLYERDYKGGKEGKPEPQRPHLDELTRKGLPQRIDRDVTTQDFIDHFGFRGIEFGNWSAQDDRQRILNMAYDGLADLAEIMGVPHKAMSLNGTMGMAFGARGGGRFAAHYEPGKLVINMTKLRGGGSLAHEWAHALDHYFGELDQPDAYKGKARGASGWYDEGQYNGLPITRMEQQPDGRYTRVERQRLANLRPELATALDRVMSSLFQAQITKAEMVQELEGTIANAEALAAKEADPSLRQVYERTAQGWRETLAEVKKDPEDKTYARGKSQYAKEAQKLSGKSEKGYWLRPTEMFARAFESWVFDRVVAMGARSDYLVHGVEETRFAGGAYKGNPYPVGKERAAINTAFDKLADTIETKPTDNGVAMFRRGDRAGGLDLEARKAAIQKLVTGMTSGWVNAPQMVVVRDMQDEQVPQKVRDTDAAQRSQGANSVVHGFHYQGKVYLVAEGIGSAQEALETIAHEVLGHAGLQGLFGETLKPIKQQIVAMRRKEVLAKAADYGMPVSPEAVRAELGRGATDADVRNVINMRLLYAAEEVLAEMAQTTPQLGFVKRAVAAIRTWLREHVPFFQDLELTDAEIIRSFILPAREWVIRGEGTGARRSAEAAAQFSRSAPGTNPATEAPLRAQIMQAMNDMFSAPGKLNWWHRTVGTQYNLAQRSREFKRVFDSVQNFLNDMSMFATEAADLAPKILPKLETWRDIAKKPIAPQDNKAVSAPIFEGTLLWARDERGRPVKVEDLRKQAEGLSAQEKAQRMLRAGALSENVLKMWQGLPLEQFEAAVNTRFDTQMLRAGIVWTESELKSQFHLTDGQIALYKEFRSAVDRSLTRLAVTDMVRFGGKDVEGVRDEALASADVDAAALILRDHLLKLADQQPDRKDLLLDTAERMIEKADRARDLMDRGYAPLSRFGHYTVDVIDASGERVFFGMFETAREAALMARKMKGNFPQAQITRGTVSQEEYKLFAGVSPETVELFGELLGLEGQGNDAASKAFQTYIKVAKANRSAMKRLIERKGIAGFSEDVGRVLAGFVYSNARQSSQNLHMGEMTDSAAAIPKEQGELKDQATRLVEYIKNPQEEAQAFRGLLFAQYLGGSVASAMVNMLQPVQVTFPYLSQFGGATKAAARMKQALVDVKKKSTGDAALDAALKKAEEEGIVAPQEVHQLMAQASGRGVLKSGDGTPLGNARATANNALSRLALGWGKIFGAAEQFNRRVTFIAAYRTAVEQGLPDAAAFAEKAIAETMFLYNKGNRPQWARGAIGSTIFTFKTYSISYVELLHRMATQGGPQGKRAALLALGMLFLFGGAGGLPFAEDVEDLVDGVMQRLGYNLSSKLAKRQFFEAMLGKELGRFAENGISGLPGVPIDVSGRLGMGNLLPGTGLMVDKQDHARDVTEFAGAGGDFVKRLATGANKLLQGEVGGAVNDVAPRAAANVMKAYEMYTTGQYKDGGGKKVIDVDGFDALSKAIGFQPADVAQEQEDTGLRQQLKDNFTLERRRVYDAWAKAVADGDQEALAKVRERVRTWNETNPETPIMVNRSGIAERVKNLRMTKQERQMKSSPRAIRAGLREAVGEGAP